MAETDDITITETIQAEHQEAIGALANIEESGEPSEDLFVEILDNLTILNTLKNELIYPIIEENKPEVAERARAGYEEADGLLQALADLHPSDDSWMADFIELATIVRRNFEFEAASLLPVLTDVLTPEESTELVFKWDKRFDEEVVALGDELEDDDSELVDDEEE